MYRWENCITPRSIAFGGWDHSSRSNLLKRLFLVVAAPHPLFESWTHRTCLYGSCRGPRLHYYLKLFSYAQARFQVGCKLPAINCWSRRLQVRLMLGFLLAASGVSNMSFWLTTPESANQMRSRNNINCADNSVTYSCLGFPLSCTHLLRERKDLYHSG